jgi:hypothetical protein
MELEMTDGVQTRLPFDCEYTGRVSEQNCAIDFSNSHIKGLSSKDYEIWDLRHIGTFFQNLIHILPSLYSCWVQRDHDHGQLNLPRRSYLSPWEGKLLVGGLHEAKLELEGQEGH